MLRLTTLLITLLLIQSPLAAQVFTDVAFEAGIDFSPTPHGLMGGGVAVFDYDNDGWDDIYLTGCKESDKLFKNNGDFTFTDVSEEAGLAFTNIKNTMGIVTGDYDRDGFKDVFLSTWSFVPGNDLTNCYLLRNNGDGTFTDVAEEAGILDESFTVSSGFFDANNDGWLDIYCGNYVENSGFIINNGQVIGFDHECFSDVLYINNGDGTFTESSDAYSTMNEGCTLAMAMTDYDRDGNCDVMVANDFGAWVVPDKLYRNKSPELSFEDVSVQSDADAAIYAMGVAVGDYDEDQDLDYYIANLGRNVLLNNDNGITFTDLTTEAGVENEEMDGLLFTSWGTFFQDMDNDTGLDLYVSNGMIPAEDLIANHHEDPNKYYHNNQDGTFDDWSAIAGIDNHNVGRGCAYADFDKDGFLDIVQVNIKNPYVDEEAKVMLLRNDHEVGNWVGFNLEGVTCNFEAIGAMIEVHADGRTFIREISGGGGPHASQNAFLLHVGLGEINEVDYVEVFWPGGESEIFPAQINTYQTIVQGTAVVVSAEENLNAQIEVYPNPAVDLIHIQIPAVFLNSQLYLFDVSGREVFRQILSSTSNKILIPASIENGTYHLNIVGEESEDFYQKIVITR